MQTLQEMFNSLASAKMMEMASALWANFINLNFLSSIGTKDFSLEDFEGHSFSEVSYILEQLIYHTLTAEVTGWMYFTMEGTHESLHFKETIYK